MNNQSREILQVIEPQQVTEGAGVKLIRSIATSTLDHVDPFLLFDHFGSENPDDYMKGFPMHPHRGIETVTYMINGFVNHKDSLGNTGSIGPGDIQWMTSGGGIMHEEMPQKADGAMAGFQLWVNLPAKLKMSAPRYQNITADQIPVVQRDNGVTIKIIAGEVDGVHGPVKEIAAAPTYLDVSIPADGIFSHNIQKDHAAFVYVFEGEGRFGFTDDDQGIPVSSPRLIVFGDGDIINIRTKQNGVRFLLISGKPIKEPIARYGPFVMNTQDEIQQALEDLRNNTFIQD